MESRTPRHHPRPFTRALAGCLLAALLCPTTASAGTVVLTPPLADGSVSAKQRVGVFQLISSELDFSPEVDGVIEVTSPPATLNDSCLTSPGCLGSIMTANGGDELVAVRLTVTGGNVLLDLLLYDGARIARRMQHTVAWDPTALANAITPIVHELLTGEVPESVAQQPTESDFAPEEAFADDAPVVDLLVDVPPPAPVPAPAPAPAPPPAPPEPAPPPAPSLASAPPEAVPPPAAPAAAPVAPQPSDADLASMITFGTSVDDISAEEIDQMIQFQPPPDIAAIATPVAAASPPPPAPAPAPVPAARPTPPEPAPRPVARAEVTLTEEEAELAALERDAAALDHGPRRSAKAATSSRGTATIERSGRGERDHLVQVTGRGGYSRYYSFDFVTGGGEVGVAVLGGLHVVGGAEVYAVERVLPPDVQRQEGIYSEWNFIFPLNAGLIYKFPLGMARPYVGADAIVVQYYRDEIGSDWAGGARFRAGVDLMVVPTFGFNVNLAAGGWFGQNWALIEAGVDEAGFLPQVSGGALVAF